MLRTACSTSVCLLSPFSIGVYSYIVQKNLLHSVQSSAEVKNEWICNSTAPKGPRDVHKDKFTVPLRTVVIIKFTSSLSFVRAE